MPDPAPAPAAVPLPPSSPALIGMVIARADRLPITSRAKGYLFEVELPPQLKIAGVSLADHVKKLDWRARRVVFAPKAPTEVVTGLRERLRALLGP